MSEHIRTTKEARAVRCQQAVDRDRQSINEQIDAFFEAGGKVTEIVQDNEMTKKVLARKYRAMVSDKSTFKGIGLGDR